MRRVPANWGKKFFRKEIFSPGDPEHLAAAPREAAFARSALGLKRGERLLDLCCGTGRHSIPLARGGLNVVGLDITPAYLREARKRGKKVKNLRFVRGDMRRLANQAEFDGIINLWTSFGYFKDLQDDKKVLRGVARALKPGGAFLIEIVNADYLRKHGQRKFWHIQSDGSYLLQDFEMDEGRDPSHTNRWTVLRLGRKPAFAEFFVRSYNRDRLSRSLRAAGLRPAGCVGGLDGRPFHRTDSPRLVLLAKKRTL